MQSSKIDRIKYLVEQLNAASESYYAKDREIMSNYEYDKLYDELVELEKETGVTGQDQKPGRTAGVAAGQPCNFKLETGRTDHCVDLS